MTAADQIFSYIQSHGKATRPELERAFGLYEKTVDSAIRKLERLGCIKRAGKAPKVGKQRRAVIFAIADARIDLSLIGDCRGRPRVKSETKQAHSFDALNQAMGAFFGREAA